MKILLVSDSHGHARGLLSVLDRHRDIPYVIHAGDYGADVFFINEAYPSVVTEAVQGNNDKSVKYPLEKVVQLVGKRIFITHGHAYNVGRDLTHITAKALQEKADIAVFGHTHIPLVERRDGLLLVNPGSVFRGRSLHGPTYAILEITREEMVSKIYSV